MLAWHMLVKVISFMRSFERCEMKQLKDVKKNKTERCGFLVWVMKAFIAGVIAFALLNIFCLFYNKQPMISFDTKGATAHKYGAHEIYSIAQEGYGRGRTNNDGYMNMFDYDENEGVDVLISGGSDMEAKQVGIDQCTASVLNMMLPDDIVYNIGIKTHYLDTCCACLPAAMEAYHPSKYYIIETGRVLVNNSDLENVVFGKPLGSLSHSGKIVDFLRHFCYLRLVYGQITALRGLADEFPTAENEYNDPVLLNAMLSGVADTTADAGVKLIIAYCPNLTLDEDGNIQFDESDSAVDAFSALCEDNGIYFLDMRVRILEDYEKDHILPRGFFNTSVKQGHPNAHGHHMLAEELFDLINEIDSVNA